VVVVTDRPCGWCRVAIAPTARGDARWCSKPCRQAAHRARFRDVRIRATDRPLRLAYADPPYPGNARRLYGEHPDFAGEVDHATLIRRLSIEYDGWALSTSAAALPAVLAECVAQDLAVRVAAWVKGRARPHPTARVRQAWEPVVWIPARQVVRDVGRRVEDALVGVASRRRPTLPGAVVGMKPPAFCYWLFDLLAAAPGDTFDDLFPGSGIVGWAWASFSADGDASPRAACDASSQPGRDLSLPAAAIA
jgi:hypothetical protein